MTDLTPDQRRAIEWDCTRLIHLYIRLNDAARWDELAALYVPEGRMARPSAPDQLIEGRDAILAAFRARPPRFGVHLCTNVIVDVEDEATARAESRILLFLAADEGNPPAAAAPLIGTFHDKLCRTAEGWRFVERLGRLLFRP